MKAKEHYDTHLGNFYSWMIGDKEPRIMEFRAFLLNNNITPDKNPMAIDLGAGNGIQTLALAQCGFKVKAIDFNDQLINELKIDSKGYDISIVNDDIRNVRNYATDAGIIICCGDTLTHLESKQEVQQLVADIADTSGKEMKLIFSFRDYSVSLTDLNRFIPVKSDDKRILTCVLDFHTEYVLVTDLLHEKTSHGWIQKVSSYKKLRIDPEEFVSILAKYEFKTILNLKVNGIVTIVAQR
ncbi:MAG: methyltransferase domain-containing protein [Cytophagaceae bacterium]